ncbi:PAS domain-containing sensor histidine kinase [uncultured Algimonas sp.]|uniref:sensor histidine kinase n=1 Tax=uncultured Algimonas sp. TaxID=1547920 RepID=UPI00262ECC7C|nr:PAS domain-containing sensor histidine kinase [uncultured Algimonas sp.]
MEEMTSSLPTSGLNAVMNTLVDAAIIIDSDGMIRLINPAGEDIFGYRADDLIGQNIAILMPEPYRSEHDDYIRHHLETGETRIIGIGREVEGRRNNGEVFPMHLAVGEMGRNGSTLFVGIVRDLTEERETQAAFDALQLRHFHLSRVAAMNEMGTAIAHEINQPLAATANYIETAKILSAQAESNDERMADMLDYALQQNNRAADIIARMRTFIERGDVILETVDLDDVIDASLMLSLSKYRETELEIVRRIAAPSRYVHGDAVQIQQVFVNLIRNACEAMTDSETKRLMIDARNDKDHADMIRISISDNGSGLEEEAIANLFTAFTSTKSTGLGVGLSISRSIVRAHGGRIWATANAEGGATFSFTLPHARTDVHDAS